MKYVGKLCYLEEGRYGTITGYTYGEDRDSGANGITETFYARYKGGSEDIELDEKPLIFDSLRFFRTENATIAVAKVHGKPVSVGYALLNPKDKRDFGYGKQLALARAVKDFMPTKVDNDGKVSRPDYEAVIDKGFGVKDKEINVTVAVPEMPEKANGSTISD